MLKKPSVVTWLWKKVKSVTVVLYRMSRAKRTYVVKVVMKPVAANVYREKLAGRLNIIFYMYKSRCCSAMHIVMAATYT